MSNIKDEAQRMVITNTFLNWDKSEAEEREFCHLWSSMLLAEVKGMNLTYNPTECDYRLYQFDSIIATGNLADINCELVNWL